MSNIPGYFECAEIFELPVDGDPTEDQVGHLRRGRTICAGTFRR